MTTQAVPLKLRMKHRLAVSDYSGAVSRLRGTLRRIRLWRRPEVGLVLQEDSYVEAVMKRLIARDADCLDVGAHVGSMADMMRRMAPRGTLTMVEASPAKADMLSASFPKATLHRVAVSDTTGEVSFYENLAQPGFSSLADRSNRGETREIRVPCETLDTLMAGCNVDFLKIDVEGFEYEALKGASDLLKRCAPVIQFEAGAVTDSALDTGKTDTLFTMLRDDYGYRIYAAFDLYFGRPPIELAQFRSYRTYPVMAFNYFAVPPGVVTPDQKGGDAP